MQMDWVVIHAEVDEANPDPVTLTHYDRRGSRAGFSSANMTATCRLVVPWMRVSAQRASQ